MASELRKDECLVQFGPVSHRPNACAKLSYIKLERLGAMKSGNLGSGDVWQRFARR
jgi:hypothetical protein